MHVPLNNLLLQHQSLEVEIYDAFKKIFNNSDFIRGESVEIFEENFANLIGSKHCISCANGTDALYISLISMGINPGDEVIVPAQSWISTSQTVTQAGGIPVFCDIDFKNLNIDPNLIIEKITTKTVGIVPVHLYGHPAPMDKFTKIAKDYKLWVLEDCAQAHLATFNNINVGLFGKVASFSFYPGKNLGAMGDAGAIITNDDNIAIHARKFSKHGGLKKGQHDIEGINSRMDSIQAAILNIKLKYIQRWTDQRRNISEIYLKNIKNVALPLPNSNVKHAWHQFVIKTDQRDSLMNYLKKHDIQTGINYPTSLPFLDAYKRFKHTKDDFPVAYDTQSKILSIPIFPELTDPQIEYVIEMINSYKYD